MALAQELSRKELEKYLLPVVEKYWELATGMEFPGSSRHKPPKLDPATNRHYMERFVAPAARSLNVNSSNSSESFFMKVMEEYRNSQGDIKLPAAEEEEAESVTTRHEAN